MSDDITFCGNECDNTKCRRHRSNIQEPQYPHSVAYLEGTEYCEKKPIDLNEVKAIAELAEQERPQGDLISRSALKEAFKEAYAGITFSLIECNDLINNAPTVEPNCEGCTTWSKSTELLKKRLSYLSKTGAENEN